MLILRPVQVKARVTQRLKAELGRETRQSISQLDEEIERIRARLSAKKSASSPVSSLEQKDERSFLERKEAELKTKRDALLVRLDDIERLKDGQEIISNQVQSVQSVEVGDVWPSSDTLEIVLEDGKVVAIRKGSTVTVTVPEGVHEEKNSVESFDGKEGRTK